MTAPLACFKNRHAILPVVHVRNADVDHAVQMADLAVRLGADGVFFISHTHPSFVVLECALRASMLNIWSGVNLLVGENATRFAIVDTAAKAVWGDWRPKRLFPAPLLTFGGAAFKYLHEDIEPEEAAARTARTSDVVVTSGEATGSPPSVLKVERIKDGAGGRPVGIASGLTPENVRDYLHCADVLMVATGVSRDFHTFDERKLSEFIANVRSFSCSA